MTDSTTTPDTQPIRLVALTNDEWEIVDFHRRMSDISKDALRRVGEVMAAADEGLDRQRSTLERGDLNPAQEEPDPLQELRLLPEDERKSAIQWLRDLLARAEQEAA